MAVASLEGFMSLVDAGEFAEQIALLETMMVGNRGRGGEEGEEMLLIARDGEDQQDRIAEFFRVGYESADLDALADVGTADLEIAEMLREYLNVSGYFEFRYNEYNDYVLKYHFS